MIQTISAPNTVPTANLAVNKSRMKLYKNAGDMPTYFLQKGQEFQIELFNPTSDVVLAKIILNGNPISQGGLVLNPGVRIFLDRYLDVAKKFLFDTYNVANTSAVKKAIEDNGDIKIDFYRESKPVFLPYVKTYNQSNPWGNGYNNTYSIGTDPKYLRGMSTGGSGSCGTVNSYFNNTTIGDTNLSGSLSASASGTASAASGVHTNALNFTNYSDQFSTKTCSMDSFSFADEVEAPKLKKRLMKSKLSKQSIETGRVEEGSHSDQEFRYVDKSFDYLPFHTVEYKLLPVSQKVNTIGDISVKVYCTQCGSKLGKTDRFCSSCGKQA